MNETWTGDTELPPDLNKPVNENLCNLRTASGRHGNANAHLAKEPKNWIACDNI
jgi:hypothetical protein